MNFWKIQNVRTGLFWDGGYGGRGWTKRGSVWATKHGALVELDKMFNKRIGAHCTREDVSLVEFEERPVGYTSARVALEQFLCKRTENAERRVAADKRARIRDAERRLAEARKP